MTIKDALERVKYDRPGESTEAEMIKWLSQLDGRWADEVIMTHEPVDEDFAFEGYDESTDRETELLIGEPDDETYIYWLYSRIDFRLGEIERYNADAALFNTAWNEAAKRYNRHYLPRMTIIHRVAYGDPAPYTADEDPLNQRRGW